MVAAVLVEWQRGALRGAVSDGRAAEAWRRRKEKGRGICATVTYLLGAWLV